MSNLYTGEMNLASSFHIQIPSPIDDRFVVESFQDLVDNFIGGEVGYYTGLQVYVANEKQFYVLTASQEEIEDAQFADDVESTIAAYWEKVNNDVDEEVINQYVTNYINQQGIITETVLETKLVEKNYVTTDAMNDALEGKSDSDHNHNDVYAPISHTHEDLETELAKKANASDLEGKADKSELETLATKNEVEAKADKSELESYVKTETLTKTYATKEELDATDEKIDDESNRAIDAESALSERIENLENEDNVVWSPSSETRKHIVLANHDSVVGAGANCTEGQENGYEGGKDLTGENFNLVMMSKWNVADFGSSSVHMNLNSEEGKVTINDEKTVATVEDIDETYAKKSELPTDYLTEGDLEDYAKKSELPTDYVKSDEIADMATKTELGDYLTTEEAGNKYQEKGDYATTESLEGKADSDHNHDDVYSKLGHTHDNYLTEDDLNGYAKTDEIPEIPTNVSAFTNDAGYLTEHQSLEDYAKKSELPTDYVKSDEIADMATKTELGNVDKKVDENTSAISAEAERAAEAEGELSNRIDTIENEDSVIWSPSDETRKHIVLANHDSVVGAGTNCTEGQTNGYEGGKDLTGENFNLVMMSKWNVADFGSSSIHMNLNSEDGKVTINDKKTVATVEDIDETYAKKSELPTDYLTSDAIKDFITAEALPVNVSELENDAEYVTAESLEGKKYVDEAFVRNAILEAQLDGSDIEVDLSGLESLSNKLASSENSISTEDEKYTSAGYVDKFYAKKSDIPTDYLTASDLDGYVTETALEEKGYLTADDLPTNHEITTNKVTSESDYASSKESDDNYVSAKYVETNYASQAFVTQKIAEAQLEGEDVDLTPFLKVNNLVQGTGITIDANTNAETKEITKTVNVVYGTLSADAVGNEGEEGYEPAKEATAGAVEATELDEVIAALKARIKELEDAQPEESAEKITVYENITRFYKNFGFDVEVEELNFTSSGAGKLAINVDGDDIILSTRNTNLTEGSYVGKIVNIEVNLLESVQKNRIGVSVPSEYNAIMLTNSNTSEGWVAYAANNITTLYGRRCVNLDDIPNTTIPYVGKGVVVKVIIYK